MVYPNFSNFSSIRWIAIFDAQRLPANDRQFQPHQTQVPSLAHLSLLLVTPRHNWNDSRFYQHTAHLQRPQNPLIQIHIPIITLKGQNFRCSPFSNPYEETDSL